MHQGTAREPPREGVPVGRGWRNSHSPITFGAATSTRVVDEFLKNYGGRVSVPVRN